MKLSHVDSIERKGPHVDLSQVKRRWVNISNVLGEFCN